jgi:hypothetical protein
MGLKLVFDRMERRFDTAAIQNIAVNATTPMNSVRLIPALPGIEEWTA